MSLFLLRTEDGIAVEEFSPVALINGYLRYLRDRKMGNSLELHEDSTFYGDIDPDLEEWLANLPIEPS